MDIPVQIILKLVNMLSGEAKKVTGDLKGIGEAAKGIGEDAKGIADPLKQAGQEAKALGDKLKGATSHAKQLKGAFDTMGQGIGQITRGVSMMAAKFTLMKGAAYAIGGLFVKAGMGRENFEAQMRGFGISKEDAKAIKESAFNLDMDKVWGSEQDFQQALVSGMMQGVKFSDEQLGIINDAAAAGRVPVPEVAEAILMGSQGQTRGLKRWGIDTENTTVGKGKNKRKVITLTDKSTGTSMTVNEGDQRALMQAIFKLLQQRAKGADKEYADTIEGYGDTIKDFGSMFIKLVNDSGLFNEMKAQLKDFTGWLEKMRKDGTLKMWAKETSDALIELMKMGIDFAKALPELARGLKELVAPLGALKPSTLVALGVALWALPDLVGIAAGIVTLAKGLIELNTALGLAKYGTFWKIAGGIGAIAIALAALDKYRTTVKDSLNALSPNGGIVDPKGVNIASDYGAMYGQLAKQWIAEVVPGAKAYYAFMDELQGIAPQPKEGEMGPTRPDPSKTLAGRIRAMWEQAQQAAAGYTGELDTMRAKMTELSTWWDKPWPEKKLDLVWLGETVLDILVKLNNLWTGKWDPVTLNFFGNFETVRNAIQGIKDLWNSDWGIKELIMPTPRGVQVDPTGKGDLGGKIPYTPANPEGKGDRLMTPQSYTPRLSPGGGTTKTASNTVNAPINVTINAKGVDEVAFNRYAQKAAQSVKNSLRGVLNDGGVPQAV